MEHDLARLPSSLATLGGENIHFTSHHDAQAAYGAKMAEEHGVVASRRIRVQDRNSLAREYDFAGWCDLEEAAKYGFAWELPSEVVGEPLAEASDSEQYLLLCRYDNVAPDILVSIASSQEFEEVPSDASDSFRAAVDHPNFPEAARSAFAHHEKEAFRRAIALSPATSPSILSALARDKSLSVQDGVTENRNVPTKLLFTMQSKTVLVPHPFLNQLVPNEYIFERAQWELVRRLSKNDPQRQGASRRLKDLFATANRDGLAFKTEEAFREAYDYTYGEGEMGNPMLAANIFAEPCEN